MKNRTNNTQKENEVIKVFNIKKVYKRNIAGMKQWTPEEDALLISLYKPNNIKKWINLSKYFKDKNEKDCMLRFLKINPKIKKGKWSFEEDRNLFYLAKMFGYRWGKFAKIVRNRNHKQIRSRYWHLFVQIRTKNQKRIQKIEESVAANPPIWII